MKKFYIILGQQKNEEKYPVCLTGWYHNKKEASKDFHKDCVYLYGISMTLWEYIKDIFSTGLNDVNGVILKDLK